MSEDKIDLIFPILKNIQSELSEIRTDMSVIKSDNSILKESVRRIDSRMSSIDSHIAGFHAKLQWHTDEMDDVRGRLEHLEDQNPEN